MKTKKILSSVLLGTMLLINFSSTAFAITVSSSTLFSGGNQYGPNIIHEMAVTSSGVVKAVNSSISSDNLNHLYYMPSNSDPAYTEEQIDTANTNTEYYASIALDSSGNPGIAWKEWDSVANTGKLFYRKYNGTSWGNTITVATGLGAYSSVPALGFYRDGGDANYATIISCGTDTGGVQLAEYKANNADLSPTFASPVTISSDGSHQCSAADLHVTSTDNLIVAIAPNNQVTTAYEFAKENGTWGGGASTIFTGIDVQNTSNIFIDADSNGGIYAAILDDASGSGTDTILYNRLDNGSWGTQQTVASGVRIGQQQIDIVLDTDNDIPYVLYFDNANNKIKYSYYNNSSWTAGDISTSYTFATYESDYQNHIAGSYYSGGSKIISLANIYVTSSNYYNKYELTDLAEGGGGQGGGAPEFSTLVYTMTALMLFGMVYWKSESGKIQNA